MPRLTQIVLRTIIIFFVLMILFVVGLVAGLPVIPWIETDYCVVHSDKKLADGVTLTNKAPITLEVENIYSERDQCFDTRFTSSENENLTVTAFSFLATTGKGSLLEPTNIYLFGNTYSRFNGVEINSLNIIKSDTSYQAKFRFIRNAFDLRGVGKFNLDIKVNYLIAGRQDSIESKLEIEKKHRLTFNGFRLH